MDHIVHINNGSGEAKPIVLRLLPGEETIFNLKILNDGEPSNISLLASSPVFKAVRLKKPDHYVVLEEIIPILARMPADKKRLDGEILLSSRSGESRVPITLLRDSEDPGDDLEDPGLQGDKELKDDEVDADDQDDDEENYERVKRVNRLEDEDEDEDEGGDDYEEKEKEPRRIAFSRDKDLQSYRSATRRQRAGGMESRGERRPQKPAGSRAGKAEDLNNERSERSSNVRAERRREDEIEDAADDDNRRVENRFKARIDDRFVDPGNRQDDGPRFIPRQVPLDEPEEWDDESAEERSEERTDVRKRATSGFEDRPQDLRQGLESEEREIPISSAGTAAERLERAPEDPEAYVEPDEGLQSVYQERLGGFGGIGAFKIIPAVLFLALVIALVMTFITQSIPEFPGALASSILIVTLIIYGAATLLKA